jgi:phosphoglycolate phosphatase-like HAD superfamily hydrolase
MGGSITITQERSAPSRLVESRRTALGACGTRMRRMTVAGPEPSPAAVADGPAGASALPARPALQADRPIQRTASPRPCRLSGVVFALENVLYDASAWQRRLRAVVSAVGWEVSLESVRSAWQAVMHSASGGRVAACLELLGLPRSAADELARASSLFGGHELDAMRPFPASRGVLTRLADDGVRLAAVVGDAAPGSGPPGGSTHDAPGRARSLLRRLGIESRVGILRFDEHDGGTLLATLREIALEWHSTPASLAFVGHTAGELEAARRAGWRSFAIDPSPAACAGSVRVADWIELEETMRAP